MKEKEKLPDKEEMKEKKIGKDTEEMPENEDWFQ